MFDGIISFISGIITPVTKVIDELHTSSEEKLELKQAMMRLESRTLIKLNQLVLDLTRAQAAVISAELQHGNWLTKSWRPMTMLFFLLLIALDTFGLLARPLNPAVWQLLQIGIGGYVVGRSAEKIVTSLKIGRRDNDNAVG